MPEKQTLRRARKKKREGKAPSTQAGEFVREEMHHIREGKHGAKSKKQAVAIGLSKARRAGVRLKPPKKGQTSAATRRKAGQDSRKGQSRRTHTTSRSSDAITSTSDAITSTKSQARRDVPLPKRNR
ncbi:MAG TPA: DUF6496 domain-containing protein, partial [Nitrospiraceae bacterium]|nr:DUF6496 domain-containing protein [Nitrospiraceae bacterium]